LDTPSIGEKFKYVLVLLSYEIGNIYGG